MQLPPDLADMLLKAIAGAGLVVLGAFARHVLPGILRGGWRDARKAAAGTETKIDDAALDALRAPTFALAAAFESGDLDARRLAADALAKQIANAKDVPRVARSSAGPALPPKR